MQMKTVVFLVLLERLAQCFAENSLKSLMNANAVSRN
jgi:hypothetical protein